MEFNLNNSTAELSFDRMKSGKIKIGKKHSGREGQNSGKVGHYQKNTEILGSHTQKKNCL